MSLVTRTTALVIAILAAGLMLFSGFSYAILAQVLNGNFEAKAQMEAMLLADRVGHQGRAHDHSDLDATVRDILDIEGLQMLGVRAYDDDGALMFSETSRGARELFDRLPDMRSGASLPDVVRIGATTIVRLPIHTTAQGPSDSAAATLDVAFDRADLMAGLRADAVWLFAISGGLLLVLGATIFAVLRQQVARPLERAIRAMQGLARERTDLDLPAGDSLEIRRMNDALRVFRDNAIDRQAFAERSARAEARNADLETERRKAEQADRAAEIDRATLARQAAERRLAEQEHLQADLRTLLAAANEGDFRARIPLENVPQGQVPLRETINTLFARMEAGVDDVIGVLAQMGDGNIWVRMEGDYSGSFARLQAATNAMGERLGVAMADLSRHAAGILDDSSDLSASAEDLSKRTERTAGSLAETANALQQIVEFITDTADLTANARGFAEAARQEARQSDAVVQDAVHSMQEIQAVSEEISRTLGIINDIAFQTNLLALNAGVEAARAGEAGRGFAVVASEVRALAQRAADAAQQIGALIETSSDQIDRGVQRVARTGETLRTLGDSIEKIGDQIATIAQAATSQSSAAAEINRAMGEIDGATQQNTAMFEEVTTANLSLKGAASRMLRLIERFELRQDDGAFRAWAADAMPAPVIAARAGAK